MTSRRWPLGRRRGYCVDGRALALSCVLMVSFLALVAPGRAAASGTGSALTFTPSGGPIGSQVTVTVSIAVELPGPTPYLLSATPDDPVQRGCGDGVTISDAPKIVIISGQPATTTFTWPTELDAGPYYLCASPAADQQGPTVWSQQPFSVTGSLLSGPTPTPSDAGVAAEVPSSGVAASGTFSLIVDADAALGGNVPFAITLLNVENVSTVLVRWEQIAQDGVVYTYAVTVPDDTPPGEYIARVAAQFGGVAAISQPFQIVSDAVVSPGGPRTSPPQTVRTLMPTATASPAGALLVAFIALLLVLAIASLLGPLRRRHAAGSPPDVGSERPPDAPTDLAPR